MKQTKILLVGSVMLAAALASCGSLDKMKEAAKQIQYKVTPEVLEAKAGKVPMSMKATVPAKIWDKKVTAEITPVLVSEEGAELNYPSITVNGESVADNSNQTINYANGGQISYAEQSVDYAENFRVSDLIVKIKFTRGDKSFETSSKELELPAIAKGVIDTYRLMGDEPGTAAIGKDNFQRIINDSQAAELIYLINKADIRNGELKKDDVKAINDYIKAVKEADNKNLKDVVVAAYASPDGATDLNTNLAAKRETSAKDYINKQLKKAEAEANVITKSTPEDWDGFKAAMEKSNIEDKDLILKVLSMYSDPDVREKEIKNLSAVYKVIAEEILPPLRRSVITVNSELVGKSDDSLKILAVNDPAQLNVEEILYAAQLYDGDLDNQAKVLSAAASQFSNDWRAVNNYGVVLYKQGKVADAKAQFQAAEQVQATPEVENNLGVIALAEKNYDAAKEYFGASTSLNAALCKILNDKDDAALGLLNANDQECGLKYYLKAICSAHKNEIDGIVENLGKAIKLESKWKDYAKKDMEFYKYLSNAAFTAIVG